MKIYLVGGAVRDKLLDYPVHERDWVVVGSSPQALLDLGYKPVGKDFPVFLHPETNEEYALARTERKSGHGYAGFTFHTGDGVSLEDDLARRDLTINAIALSEDGEYIDPYNGRADIDNRILRHVSPAFIEDPVRVLRIARFAARYHHLGFTVADETLTLMQQIAATGELNHLVPERVWQEFSRALTGNNPDVFFRVLRDANALEVLMPELNALFGVPQPPKYHPEIDTGEHCMLVLQQASKLSNALTVRFACLTHDLGKGTTPESEWPSHRGHETRGLALVEAVCARLKVPSDCRQLALIVCEFHTNCHKALELKPSTLLKKLENMDSFRRPERFQEFLLCCKADARGRTGLEDIPYRQADYFSEALECAQQVSTQELIQRGFSGPQLGDALHNARLHALQQFKTHYPGELE